MAVAASMLRSCRGERLVFTAAAAMGQICGEKASVWTFPLRGLECEGFRKQGFCPAPLCSALLARLIAVIKRDGKKSLCNQRLQLT